MTPEPQPRPRDERGASAVEYALIAVLVAVFVGGPLRRDEVAAETAEADRRAELEAAKEAKYR